MLPYRNTKSYSGRQKHPAKKFRRFFSFCDRLLQYTFALSTLLVHLRNDKPLENQSIIKGLGCPEQEHEYLIILERHEIWLNSNYRAISLY